MLRRTFVATLVLAACGDKARTQDRPRCALCGMRIDPRSGWRAGATLNSRTLVFDTPKCLFRYRHREGELRDAWVIEYYAQERRNAADLFYVLGSDLMGPMGRDLVPVQGREAAEALRRDHQGQRVLSFAEVTPAIVEALFRPGG